MDRRPQRYVLQVDHTTSAARAITTFTTSQLGERPFIAPVINTVQLAGAVDGRVAIWYPLERYIQVVENGAITTTIKGCLDRKVKAAYDSQMGGLAVRGFIR
jgi:hypothetical protein